MLTRQTKQALLISALVLLSIPSYIYGKMLFNKYYLKYTNPGVVTINPANYLEVVGPVSDLSEQINKINFITRTSEDNNIYIGINSPGGRLDTTELFLRIMQGAKQQGMVFTCIVDGMAASAAVIILSECDNRYALMNSGILWHSMLSQGIFRINESMLADTLTFFQIKNDEIWANTRKHFFPGYFIKHFVAETMLLATEVEENGYGFLSVVNGMVSKIDNSPITVSKPEPPKIIFKFNFLK